MRTEQQQLTINLHCIELPGRRFEDYADIRVGVQKGDAVVDDVFGDATHADFVCELRVERNPRTGKPNFLGPFAHGKPTERFLYLCWGVRVGPHWHGFRRAKIHLRDFDWPTIERAIATKRALDAVVKLTDEKGGPLCASVKADHITWRA